MNLRQNFQQFMDSWLQASQEPFTGHPLAGFFRGDCGKSLTKAIADNPGSYRVKASIGGSSWVTAPWLCVVDKAKTDQVIYPAYFFCADGSGFYLALHQYTPIAAKKRFSHPISDKVTAPHPSQAQYAAS